MLAGIATLSDEGLRRSYFSKVEINRQIVAASLREASQRGLPLEPLTGGLTGESDPQQQLGRMLDIGLRLNARRETPEPSAGRDLPRFILDEAVELTGAERAALILQDEEGQRQVVAKTLRVSSKQGLPKPEGSFLDEMSTLLDEAWQKRTSLLRYTLEDAPELEQRSVLCAPLWCWVASCWALSTPICPASTAASPSRTATC
jgi:hypothetical protein